MHNQLAVALIILLLPLAGCDILGSDDEPQFADGVFVGNQGDFGTGNGSVSLYDPASNNASVVVDELESIVQSIEVRDGRLYVAANTGGRVDVFDASTRQRLGSVEGLVSPRYMAFSDDRLFVTNLYGAAESFAGGLVSVIDRETLLVEEEVAVGDNPEGIAVSGNRVYAANQEFGAGSTLSAIDLTTLEVVETIDVDCEGPRFLTADNDGDVFVFCTGRTIYDDSFNPVGETEGAIRVIDGATGAITERIAVDGRMMSEEFGQDAYFDAANDRIFALQRSIREVGEEAQFEVLVIDTRSNTVSSTIGPVEGNIGAVAFDDVEDVLYLSDVTGFTTSGTVRVFSLQGEQLRSSAVGVAPTSLAIFRR